MENYNPRAIHVIVLGEGCYQVYEDNGEPVLIPFLPQHDDYHDWVLNMNDTELEAAIQVYWDMWNFQSGDDEDQSALTALEAERTRRKQPTSSFAPGIFR